VVHLLWIVVHQLTLEQVQGRFVVQNNIVKGVGDNFCHPNQAGLYIFQEEQMNGSEKQACNTQNKP
jgi:hypothetical protein